MVFELLAAFENDAADAAGLDHNYIGMIERGERNPAVVNVLTIAKALGVPPGELFRDFK